MRRMLAAAFASSGRANRAFSVCEGLSTILRAVAGVLVLGMALVAVAMVHVQLPILLGCPLPAGNITELAKPPQSRRGPQRRILGTEVGHRRLVRPTYYKWDITL